MKNIDFLELSQESVRRYKESIEPKEYNEYANTLYVAISEDDRVSCSYDPRILEDASKCILIHCMSSLAVKKWYKNYKIEYINEKGLNNGGILGNDCYVKIIWVGQWANQVLFLHHGENEIYECKPPFEGHMQTLWDTYCQTYKTEEDDLTKLKKEIVENGKRIQELEMKISQYEQILAGVKESIKEFGE